MLRYLVLSATSLTRILVHVFLRQAHKKESSAVRIVSMTAHVGLGHTITPKNAAQTLTNRIGHFESKHFVR